MILKKLVIQGFKSFADKTEIVVDKGITGIVGPNGSGKSNVADAIRWVLGEQSTKNLRGDKMEDFIFNGAEGVNPKAYCEVALYFDNQDGQVDCEYSEIVVARKMYRSGESNYYLNKNIVRLKDILELFRDTGIGKEGYSIIGQGRVDDILSSKSLSRRKVFEEAAGIMKYRVRKEEAEKKLQKTDENLERVEDILEELKEQIVPLKTQMEETKAYLTLQEELKGLELASFLVEWDKNRQRQQQLQELISQYQQDIQKARDSVQHMEEEYRRENAKMETASKQKEGIAKSLMELRGQIEQKRGSIRLLEEKKRHNRQRREEIERENQKSALECQDSKKLIEALEIRQEENRQKVAALEGEMEALLSSMEQVSGKNRDYVEQLEGKKNRRQEVFALIGEADMALSRLSESATNKEEYLGGIEQQLEEAQKNQKGLLDGQKRLEQDRQQLAQKNRQQTEKINALKVKQQQKEQEQSELSQELLGIQRELGECESQYSLLDAMSRQFEGYVHSVKNLLSEAEKNREIGKLMVGPLAELVKVPGKYEQAVEIVLGNALQNIVVETQQDAKQIIQFLREKNLGRVTFMPLDALSYNTLSEAERKKAQSVPGFLCVASEAVQFGGKVAPAVEFLLARTVITEDLDSAVKVANACGRSFRVVSLKGDMVKPGGVMTGGSTGQNKAGLLSRKRALKELEVRIEQLKGDVELKQMEMQTAKEDGEFVRMEVESAIADLREIEVSTATIMQQQTATQENLDRMNQAIAEYQQQKNNWVQVLEDEKAQRQKHMGAKAALEMELEELETQLAQMKNDFEQDSQQINHWKDQVNKLKIKHIERVKDGENIQSEKEFLIKQEQTSSQRIQSNLQALKELEEEEADIARQMENAGQGQEQIIKEQQVLTEREGQMEQQLAAHKQTAAQLRRNIEEAKDQNTGMVEEIYKTENQLSKLQDGLEAMQNKIWEDYELTYAGAEPYRQENFSPQKTSQRIRQIRDEMKQMGPINPGAINDYNRVKERVDFLETQREDLGKAKDDLNVVIDKLMHTMEEHFLSKFRQIDKYFQSIFGELFGGGKAQLKLEEGDVLSSGIDIIVQPPGKKLQNISLLSGGERALTAIALLFAMLKINPSPMCLLDEIDAPLDEENVIRYSEYLKNLVDQVQFLIITHRKPTMAICDTLYGIAMEQKGVSKVISVRLQ